MIKQTGANIGTLAFSVNVASQSRFEVASETQKKNRTHAKYFYSFRCEY